MLAGLEKAATQAEDMAVEQLGKRKERCVLTLSSKSPLCWKWLDALVCDLLIRKAIFSFAKSLCPCRSVRARSESLSPSRSPSPVRKRSKAATR